MKLLALLALHSVAPQGFGAVKSKTAKVEVKRNVSSFVIEFVMIFKVQAEPECIRLNHQDKRLLIMLKWKH